MASRIYLELNYQEERKINFFQNKQRSSSKTETKILKNISTTPKGSEIRPRSPLKHARKYFEVRRISYQTIKQKHNKTELPTTLPRPLSNKSERNRSISPKKLNIKRFNSSKNSSFEEIDPIPTLPSRTYYNERLIWHKRKDKNFPLCILNFNGVLGDSSKSPLSDTESKFAFVEGVKSGLRLLNTEFNVVIISWYSRKLTKQLISLLEEQDIEFDAFYIVRHRNLKYRFRHNYSQILEDFQVKDSFNETLLITSLVINREEMIERRGADLFYESTLSGCNRYTSFGLPPNCSELEVKPLCILVPHCKTSDDKISLLELSRFVLGLKNKCFGQLENADFDGIVSLPCEHQDLPLIPKRPNTDSGLRFIVYTFCRSRKLRPPISRKSSKFK